MKFILIGFLLLTSCYRESESKIEDVCTQLKANRKGIHRLDCTIGLLIAVNVFNKQLKGKVSQRQVDTAFAACEGLEK